MAASKTQLPVLSRTQQKMVADFQCPGCAAGLRPNACDSYSPLADEGGFRCTSHHPGTIGSGIGLINLGLPKGFCRTVRADDFGPKDQRKIILHVDPKTFSPDDLNVPVWAMEKDGYLFVRMYMPRVDLTCVHVVGGGTLADVPRAIDVGKFVDEID